MTQRCPTHCGASFLALITTLIFDNKKSVKLNLYSLIVFFLPEMNDKWNIQIMLKTKKYCGSVLSRIQRSYFTPHCPVQHSTWISGVRGGRIIDNLQIDNQQIYNRQIDNQNLQIDNLKITVIS